MTAHDLELLLAVELCKREDRVVLGVRGEVDALGVRGGDHRYLLTHEKVRDVGLPSARQYLRYVAGPMWTLDRSNESRRSQ